MRVLLVSPSMVPAKTGGPSYSTYWLACGLQENGVDVTVATTDRCGLPKDVERNTLVNYGVPTYYFEKRIRLFVFTYPKMIRWIRNHLDDFDLIHFQSYFFTTAIWSALAARFKGKPIVVSPRGEIMPEAMRYARMQKMVNWLPAKIAYKYAWYHCTSDAEEAFLKLTIGPRPTFVAPNLLPCPRIDERVQMPLRTLDFSIRGNILDWTTSPKEWHGSKMPIPSGSYLLSLGRIYGLKAIDKLIESIAIVKRGIPDVLLLIAGCEFKNNREIWGGLHQRLYNMVGSLGLEGNVYFICDDDKDHTMFITGELKRLLFHNAAAFVLPSDTESFGLTVVEALRESTPVIASEYTPWRVLEDTGAGLTTSNEPRLMAAMLTYFLRLNKHERDTMSVCAKALSGRYDYREGSKEYIKHYQEILG